MQKYFRPELAEVSPPQFPPTEGMARLHLNENPYPLPPPVHRELLGALGKGLEFNRYGQPTAEELRREVASYAGVDPEWVYINNGSDGIIFSLHLAFGGPDRQMAIAHPTFPSYLGYAGATGTQVVPVDLEADFSLPLDNLLEVSRSPATNLTAVCNPNNPTGNLFDRRQLERLITEADSLVVVDEAYFEYCGETVAPLLEQNPHLMVMRTFSKAFSAAGIRLGYLLGHPDLIWEVRKARQPFALGLFPQVAGRILLQYRQLFMEQVQQLQRELQSMVDQVNSLPGAEAFPSHTNFFLVRTPLESQQLVAHLRSRRVLVADAARHPLLKGCIRVSLGRPEENQAFLDALARILDEV